MKRDLLEKLKGQLDGGKPLVGGWLMGRAAEALSRDGSTEAMDVLAKAVAARAADDETGRVAFSALRRAAWEGSQTAREALCGIVIDHDHQEAFETTVSGGYFPADPARRALFYFLTYQWKKYEELDSDFSFIKTAYTLAGGDLKRRIADTARAAGKVEMVGIIAGGTGFPHLDEMTDDEWISAIDILEKSGSRPDLWRLARSAPAVRSVGLMKRLGESGWKPPDPQEAPAFEEILSKALECDGEPPPLWPMPFPCPVTFAGHAGPVGNVSFTPDGRHVVASSRGDCTVRFWSLPGLHLVKTLEAFQAGYHCMAVSRDGGLVALGGENGKVRVWSFPEGTMLGEAEAPGGSPIKRVAMSPDAALIATAGDDAMVRLWRLPDLSLLMTLRGHEKSIYCLDFSPDAATLASGSDDRTVRLWNVADGRQTRCLSDHEGPVTGLMFGPDGRTFASASEDTTIRLYGFPGCSCLKKLKGHRLVVYCLAFSPDGNILASGSADGTVRLWDARSGRSLAVLQGHGNHVSCLAVSPDGGVLASGGMDQSICLWRLPGGELLKKLEGHEWHVYCLSVSPDGRTLASGSGDCTIRLWSLPDGSLVSKTGRVLAGTVRQIALSPDGGLLAFGGADGDNAIPVWNVQNSIHIRSFPGAEDGLRLLTISPDGKRLLSVNGIRSVILWNLAGGGILQNIAGLKRKLTAAAVAPDWKLLALAEEGGTVKLMNLETPGKPKALGGIDESASCLCFSGDGRILACGTASGFTHMWSLPSGDILGRMGMPSGEDGIAQLAFLARCGLVAARDVRGAVRLWGIPGGRTVGIGDLVEEGVDAFAPAPDGESLLMGTGDGRILLYDVPGRCVRKTLAEKEGGFNCFRVSPDGRVLAGGGANGEVRLWSLPHCNLMCVLQGDGQPPRCLEFSSNGGILACGGDSGSLRAWRLRPVAAAIPMNAMSTRQAQWLREMLREEGLEAPERKWLGFMMAMIGWRRRFDPGLDEVGDRKKERRERGS